MLLSHTEDCSRFEICNATCDRLSSFSPIEWVAIKYSTEVNGDTIQQRDKNFWQWCSDGTLDDAYSAIPSHLRIQSTPTWMVYPAAIIANMKDAWKETW